MRQRLAARLPVAAVGWVGLAEVLGVVEDLGVVDVAHLPPGLRRVTMIFKI